MQNAMTMDFTKNFQPRPPYHSLKATLHVPIVPFDVSTIMEMQRRNAQALSTAQQLTLESLQVIAQRFGAMMTDFTAEQTDLLRGTMRTAEPADKMAEQTLIMQSLYERLVQHMREINDMITQSSHETADVLHSRVGSSFTELHDAVTRAKDRRRAA